MCLLTITAQLFAFSGKYLYNIFLPTNEESKKHKDAPIALHEHIISKANGNGNKNPESIDKNIDPGIAKVCKLFKKYIRKILIFKKRKIFFHKKGYNI